MINHVASCITNVSALYSERDMIVMGLMVFGISILTGVLVGIRLCHRIGESSDE